jgi:hypothetical protein
MCTIVASVLAFGMTVRDARACSTCGCGDPTLNVLGAERPYQHRIRAGFDLRHRTDAIGDPNNNQVRLAEQRLAFFGAWAPTERLFLQLEVPVLRRELRYSNLAERTSFALGDVELRGKVFLAQDRVFVPRHLFSMTVGLKMPTAPRQRDAAGALLTTEAQPGTGSFDPILGLTYAYLPQPWSLYVSAHASAPLRGTATFRASQTLRTTVAAQYQVFAALGVRLGVDTRLDGAAFEDGAAERDSSGFIAFISPEVLVNPISDLVIFAGLRYPVWQALRGFHEEGPVVGGGIGYDFR